jgi:hypothetical protein
LGGGAYDPGDDWDIKYVSNAGSGPFGNTPNCTWPSPDCTFESATPPTYVDIVVPWCISTVPKTYFLKACAEANHSGQGTEDHCEGVEVDVQIVSVEYVAPPARANHYINEEDLDVTEGARGYIISVIARFHGQQERYGPHGGDGGIDTCVESWCSGYGGGYDDQCISDDTDDLYSYWQTCEAAGTCETDLDTLKGTVVDASCAGGA